MKKYILSVLFLGLFSLISYAQKVDLQLNLKVGETYYQNTTVTANINQTVMGQALDMEMIMGSGMSFHVLSENDKGYEIDARYTLIEMTMNLKDFSTTISSNNATEGDTGAQLFSSLVNKSIYMTISKKGELVKMDNIDEMISSTVSSFEGISPQQAEQMKAQLTESFGEESFRGNMEMLTAIYPAQKVNVGDSWATKTQIKSSMVLDVDSNFTLKNIEDSSYTISGVSSLSTLDHETEINGMRAKYNLEGTMNSVFKVDSTSGWVSQASIQQDIKGDYTIFANDQIPMDMSVPMEMKSNMEVSNQ